MKYRDAPRLLKDSAIPMRNSATSIDIAHQPLRKQYEALCRNLEQVAKVAIGSQYVQTLIPYIQVGEPIRLSDDFPDGYTTILSADDVNTYLWSGGYGEMVRRQCVVSICAYMEVFVSSLFPIVQLLESDGEGYGQFPNAFCLSIHNGNKVLRKIYYIYNHLKSSLGFETSNWENVQCPKMIDEMFTIRHVIVHFGGTIIKSAHHERISRTFKTTHDGITLPPNSIDDFVHRVTINLRSLVSKVDCYVSDSTGHGLR